MATSKNKRKKSKGYLHSEAIDIICPTYDNLQQLYQFVSSAIKSSPYQSLRIIIVNNGDIPVEEYIKHKNILVVKPKKNLGWTGGLKYGLKYAKSKYVIFANDDIFIPRASYRWAREMVRLMELYPKIGAIGPTSNVVMGSQNIWSGIDYESFHANFLIGFCMMIRKDALQKAGGIDEDFNTGDDLDLSIRLQDTGYDLIIKNDIFVYHHGFQTGEKLYGKPDKPGGWNSQKMSDETNWKLIRKHGFHRWWQIMSGGGTNKTDEKELVKDREAVEVRKLVKKGKVVELGCGKQKTVKGSIGVDIVPGGKEISEINGGGISKADIVCDIERDNIPIKDETCDTVIARHILEHIIDPIEVLKKWSKLLKKNGRLIISVPDQRLTESISMNYEHIHGFIPKSLSSVGKAVGLKFYKIIENYNNVSFTIIFIKK